MRRAESKLATDQTLANRIAGLARPLVFTNGCFDLLHRGHIDYLQQARELGSSLVVGINSDSSVKQLGKDPDRPINDQQERAVVLAALECVDLVVVFEEDTPLRLIEEINPDVLVKGGDWPVDKIVGADHVRSNGGSVYSIQIRYPTSTTGLINRIRQ